MQNRTSNPYKITSPKQVHVLAKNTKTTQKSIR